MTGAERQAARLAAKAEANATFYRNSPEPMVSRRSFNRGRILPAPVVGRAKPKIPGGPGSPDRHVLRVETFGSYERRYHATKGWRVGRA